MAPKIKTWFVIMALQMINIISSQEIIKRVPQGFLGMRGKKYNDFDEPEQFYKRRPQFFVGVKGKKSIPDYLYSNSDQHYKRAPMGFVGMRGKKDSEFFYPNPSIPSSYEYIPKQGSLFGEIDYSSNEMPNELVLPFLNQLLSEYYQKQTDESLIDTNEIKPNNESNNIPPIELLNEDHAETTLTKRAAHMNQFFGVRGKKAIKRPFDLSFRGKFVGVRGKKDLTNSGVNEIKFLLDHGGPWPKRKGQMNGFFGMRGKKWVDESSSGTEI